MEFHPTHYFFILCIILQFATNEKVFSQILVSANLGVSYSVNKASFKKYDSIVEDFKYRRYKHPSILLNGDISFPLTKAFTVGGKLGMNIHTNEQYYVPVDRFVCNFTIQVAANYNFYQASRNIAGISFLPGVNLIFVSQFPFTITPGGLYTINLFLIRKKHSFKLGLEKEIQKVTFYDPTSNNGTQINYNTSSFLLFLTYGITLK